MCCLWKKQPTARLLDDFPEGQWFCHGS
jgi:hypothetical protein